MMQSSQSPSNPKSVKGWILDVYPSRLGEFAVWIISENGQRIRLTDRFVPTVCVSGRQESLQRLASHLYHDEAVASWNFVNRVAKTTDVDTSTVLEVTVKDCRMVPSLNRRILRAGDYLQYQV